VKAPKKAKARARAPVRTPDWRALVRLALVRALISTIIALAGTVLFYVADWRHFGADISQSVYVQFPGGALGAGLDANSQTGPASADRWALVDIGPRFCAGGDSSPSICPPETSRTDPLALARLVRWIAAQEPRVVVVDIEAIRTPDELRSVSGLLKSIGRPSPPVLVALPFEEPVSAPGNKPAILIEPRAAELVAASRGTSIRFHPSQIRAPVPVARSLLTEVGVVGDPSLERLDTLSFAAAMALRAPSAHDGSLAWGGHGEKCRPMSDPCRARFEATERLFSFRPVTPADDPEARVEIDRQSAGDFQYAYVPAPAADLLDQVPRNGALQGSVVLVGDTRYSANDRPWTALGDVSGAELQLNDIRQFAMLAPAPDTLGSYLAGEAPLLAAGFLAVMTIELLLAVRRSRRPEVARDSLLYPLRSLWSLLLILLASALVAIVYIRIHHPHGRLTDFVTPFIALPAFTLCEFFLNLFAWVKTRFEERPS
jgi:hypothetical protein